MALNCVLHESPGKDVMCLIAMIRALAALVSISRGNCLKNDPDFDPLCKAIHSAYVP